MSTFKKDKFKLDFLLRKLLKMPDNTIIFLSEQIYKAIMKNTMVFPEDFTMKNDDVFLHNCSIRFCQQNDEKWQKPCANKKNDAKTLDWVKSR